MFIVVNALSMRIHVSFHDFHFHCTVLFRAITKLNVITGVSTLFFLFIITATPLPTTVAPVPDISKFLISCSYHFPLLFRAITKHSVITGFFLVYIITATPRSTTAAPGPNINKFHCVFHVLHCTLQE